MGNSDSIPSNYGFKVVEILPESPGAKCGLILNTDFVLTVNGKKLRKMTPETIKELVQENEDKELVLKVYNNVASQVRDVSLTPSRNWPGSNLLGIKIRLEPFGDLNRMDESSMDPNFSYEDVYLNENRNSTGERSNVYLSNPNSGFHSNQKDDTAPKKKKSVVKTALVALGMKKAKTVV